MVSVSLQTPHKAVYFSWVCTGLNRTRIDMMGAMTTQPSSYEHCSLAVCLFVLWTSLLLLYMQISSLTFFCLSVYVSFTFTHSSYITSLPSLTFYCQHLPAHFFLSSLSIQISDQFSMALTSLQCISLLQLLQLRMASMYKKKKKK